MRAVSRVRMVVVVAAGLFGCLGASVALASYGASVHSDVDTTRRHVLFTIASPLVTESSSLAVSTAHPNLVYTTNDSGDSASIYVLDASNGELVGRTSLAGVAAVDVEALAVGDDGTLVVGDIGDNAAERDHVAVYRLPQPGRGDVSVRPLAVTLTYPGGPRDAESLLYDSSTHRVFVASKRLEDAQVYRSPADVFGHSRARLRPVARAPAIATDATFVDGRRYAVIRTYFSAVVYRFPSWRKVDSFDLPPQRQGESVAAPAGGAELWIGTEGKRSAVLRVRLPDLHPARARGHATSSRSDPPRATRSVTVRTNSPRNDQLRSIAWRIIEAAGGALVLVVVVGLVLYRRHHRGP